MRELPRGKDEENRMGWRRKEFGLVAALRLASLVFQINMILLVMLLV
jgi:hypothetical protein